jgi:Domain of unknown function (DUF6484)
MDKATAAKQRNAETRERIQGARVGVITGVVHGAPQVSWPGNGGGPVRARTAVRLGGEALLAAAAERRGAVLVFEEGDPARPILVGLLEPETPLLDEILGAPAEKLPEIAEVDGKRVVVEGRDEVVLRCGRASITLRRNGRVVIRGVQLETRARGLQRIKGGKVEIN